MNGKLSRFYDRQHRVSADFFDIVRIARYLNREITLSEVHAGT